MQKIEEEKDKKGVKLIEFEQMIAVKEEIQKLSYQVKMLEGTNDIEKIFLKMLVMITDNYDIKESNIDKAREKCINSFRETFMEVSGRLLSLVNSLSEKE
ncbi:MAG: hypothetical protein AB1629_08365 [Candidatus Omnitrophota bacterium]